jgi:hypothetical protein
MLACLAAVFPCSGVMNVGTSLATRQREFTAILHARLWQALVTAGTALGLSAWTASSSSLVLATTLGLFAGAAVFSWSIRNAVGRFLIYDRRWARTTTALKRNQSFLHFTAPYTLVTQAFNLAVTTFIAAAYGSSILGQFNLMYRALVTPSGIVMASVGQLTVRPLVYFAAQRQAAAASTFGLSILLLCAFVPAAAAFAVYGEDLFVTIFGPSWRMAGQFSQLAALPICMLASIGWVDRLFDAWREQRRALFIGTSGCIVWYAAMVVATEITGTQAGTVSGWCLGLALNAIIWAVGVGRLIGWSRYQLVGFWLPLLGAVPIVAAHILVRNNQTAELGAVVLSTGCVYIANWLLVRKFLPAAQQLTVPAPTPRG